MSLSDALHQFRTSLAQCDNLIANSHKNDSAGAPLLPAIDREQITIAAFLNMFIAWETFLESSLTDLMAGGLTIGGLAPLKYVSPLHLEAAREMIVGVMRFFDFANHENVRKIVNIYFENGRPFEPHLSSVISELADLRIMRNSSAHITANTQRALEALGVRIFGTPRPGLTLYQLLTAIDPKSGAGSTVFVTYRDVLLVTAELIARG
jgi:hypothetical protein